MDVQIKTRGVHLTDGLQEYIQRRLAKLDRVNAKVVDAKLELRTEKNRTGGEQSVAQLTIQTRNTILRAEEKNHDLHSAIDLAIERMGRQIRRFHEKKVLAPRRARIAEPESEALAGAPGEPTGDESAEPAVRRKRFKIQPLSEGEAIEQMELLGHDFFVFYNPDAAQINVLYRRRGGEYGIIQPDIA